MGPRELPVARDLFSAPVKSFWECDLMDGDCDWKQHSPLELCQRSCQNQCEGETRDSATVAELLLSTLDVFLVEKTAYCLI